VSKLESTPKLNTLEPIVLPGYLQTPKLIKAHTPSQKASPFSSFEANFTSVIRAFPPTYTFVPETSFFSTTISSHHRLHSDHLVLFPANKKICQSYRTKKLCNKASSTRRRLNVSLLLQCAPQTPSRYEKVPPTSIKRLLTGLQGRLGCLCSRI
jgi:hypothetical protein